MPQEITVYGEALVRSRPFIVKNCGKKALDQLGKFCAELRQRGVRFATV